MMNATWPFRYLCSTHPFKGEVRSRGFPHPNCGGKISVVNSSILCSKFWWNGKSYIWFLPSTRPLTAVVGTNGVGSSSGCSVLCGKGLTEYYKHKPALYWQWRELMLWLIDHFVTCSVGVKHLIEDFHHQRAVCGSGRTTWWAVSECVACCVEIVI